VGPYVGPSDFRRTGHAAVAPSRSSSRPALSRPGPSSVFGVRPAPSALRLRSDTLAR